MSEGAVSFSQHLSAYKRHEWKVNVHAVADALRIFRWQT